MAASLFFKFNPSAGIWSGSILFECADVSAAIQANRSLITLQRTAKLDSNRADIGEIVVFGYCLGKVLQDIVAVDNACLRIH